MFKGQISINYFAFDGFISCNSLFRLELTYYDVGASERDGVKDGMSVSDGLSLIEGDIDGNNVKDGSVENDGAIEGNFVTDGSSERDGSAEKVGAPLGAFEEVVGHSV